MNLRRKSQKVTEGKAPQPKISKQLENLINLKNKKVVITGTIPGKTRISAENYLRIKYDAIIQNSVISSTDYLITGHGVGQTKLKLAARWDVKIIDATEFF